MDQFLNFLRTGAINGVRVGARDSEVRAALGPPDDTSTTRPTIWKYRRTEITFRGRRVMMIALNAHADANAVKTLLDDAGLQYQAHSDLTYDDQIAYVVGGSGVIVAIDAASSLARAFAT